MTNSTFATTIPIPYQTPLTNSDGRVTDVWYRFFLTLFQRSGGPNPPVPVPSDFSLYSSMDSDSGVQLDPFSIALAAATPQDGSVTPDALAAALAAVTAPDQLPSPIATALATTTPQDPFPQDIIAAILAYANSQSVPVADPWAVALAVDTPDDPPQQDPWAVALASTTPQDADGPLPVVAVTLGASAAVWTALIKGTLILTGGTVTKIEISRDAGTTYIDTGLTTGMIPVQRNDLVKVTYAVAPTAQNFLPG